MNQKGKQIGWKIKPEFKLAADKITGVNLGIEKDINKPDLSIDGPCQKVLKDANVLEVFCTPLYRKESVIVTIGDTPIDVIIDNKIFAEGQEIMNGTLILLIKDFGEKKEFTKKWTASIDKNVRNIRIGCTYFSLNELQLVLDKFNEWNKYYAT